MFTIGFLHDIGYEFSDAEGFKRKSETFKQKIVHKKSSFKTLRKITMS